MGSLTPVSQSVVQSESVSGGMEYALCYAKGAIVGCGGSLLASALVGSLDNTHSRVTAIGLAIFCANSGGGCALLEKLGWKQRGAADFTHYFGKAALIQSVVEVVDASLAGRFPGWIASGIVGSFAAASFYVIGSAIMSLAATVPVHLKQIKIFLEMVEFEQVISKEIEAIEGAKSYPLRLVSSTDNSILERCVVVPQDNESLQGELLAQGFERLENGANGMFFKKSSLMDLQVALFENESDLMSYMEAVPGETTSPAEAEPAVEQIQAEVVIRAKEEPTEF